MDNIENNMKDLINTLSQGQIEALGSFMVAVNVFLVQIAKATQYNKKKERDLNANIRSHTKSAKMLLEQGCSCDDEERASTFEKAAREHDSIASNYGQELAMQRTFIDIEPIWQILDDEFLMLKASFALHPHHPFVERLISEFDAIQPIIEANSQPLNFPIYQLPIIAREIRAYEKREMLPVELQQAMNPKDIAELRTHEKRERCFVEQQKNRSLEKTEAALETLRKLAESFKTGLPLLSTSTKIAGEKKKKLGRKRNPQTIVIAKKMYELYNKGKTTWKKVGKKFNMSKDAARVAAKRYEGLVNKKQYKKAGK